MTTLEKMGGFYTPKSTEELTGILERYSGDEFILAMTIMGMTWNLCSDLTNPEDTTEPHNQETQP